LTYADKNKIHFTKKAPKIGGCVAGDITALGLSFDGERHTLAAADT